MTRLLLATTLAFSTMLIPKYETVHYTLTNIPNVPIVQGEVLDIPERDLKTDPYYITMTANVSAYCACVECCESFSSGFTASGTKATANRTIAMSKDYAFGTVVEIDGNTYIVEDRGGAIKGDKIDIYFEDHAKADEFGRQTKEVKIFI